MKSLLSIYLHVPFCNAKCTYCAFNTYVRLVDLIAPFVGAIVHEIEIVAQSDVHHHIGTVFFGGGTPTLLTSAQFERILRAIYTNFSVRADAEITAEANPDDLNTGYLQALRQAGVNRLSIGMQSAIESELKLYHRRHDFDRVKEAVSSARAAGFSNLNLDLIYGAPLQTLESWRTSLAKAIELQPEHISLYALGLEEGTPLHSWVARGYLPAPDDELSADMYEYATDALEAAGYGQYEISNWARPGYECRHNLQYWRNLPYIGLGPGACGYAGGVRYSTQRLPNEYIRAMSAAKGRYAFPYTPATAEAVVVDRQNEIVETLLTGLRLVREGVQRKAFTERFGADLLEVYPHVIQKYVACGLLEMDSVTVRLTRRGRLLSNVIFRELI